ncbi:CRISPR-associated endonuclease Cas2 [Candidatus Cetobacterium colombiensis]|uniref:CRISPR-associated endoribonuclease Cas2 n=1 Tax=Candidatus Cetobacterium colombiensis TaxID=3073100 RepID=A0ABU4WE13_9FUSO|nr:CRISPR-associated endonuclease Cas2 [Candidatus Cetobacterium colombiensis]MDX8337237.1 CRISPR-associated endonuclease Cas2 [Candidatus Cetobacterium colombiensis]
MIYLITYDIESPKKRKFVSEILLSHGFKRIQKSVFLSKENIKFIEEVIGDINNLLQVKEDSIMYMPLCREDFDKSYFIGNNSFSRESLQLDEFLIF